MNPIKLLLILIVIFFFVPSIKSTEAYFEKEILKESPSIVVLTASSYSTEISKGVVLVGFWAVWNNPSKTMLPILEQISKDYTNSVKVCKLNVDDYRLFSIDKGVTVLPTIIVYKDGKEITRITGDISKESIEKTIASYK